RGRARVRRSVQHTVPERRQGGLRLLAADAGLHLREPERDRRLRVRGQLLGVTPGDWLVALAYCSLVIGLRLVLRGRQQGARDYFLGRRNLPWWAILVSVVATETSALTVISIPGIGARGDLTFLQLAFGYILGRVAVAWLLLPGYFAGDIQ